MEKILYYSGADRNSPSRIASQILALAQRENREMKKLLQDALERLEDMLKMDDGQAFKEADKFVKRELRPYLEADKRIDVV